jgi:hypothetical protein
MKKITTIILLVLICFSCSVELKNINSYSILTKIDFRKYSDAGFLITPEKYIGEYKSIGIIDFVNMPGATYKLPINVDKNGKPIVQEFGHAPGKQWQIDEMNMNDALEKLYQQCIALGADAIINFKLEPNSVYHGGVSNPVTIEGVRITGFAIKRLNKK